MNNALCLHRGGKNVTWEEVKGVVVPNATSTWVPVPHHEVVGMVADKLPSYGLTLISQQHALRNNGKQYFGLLSVESSDASIETAGVRLQVGVRNSIDKSLAAALVAGSRVFVCDNLAFSGEVALSRKHTAGIRADITEKIGSAFAKLLGMFKSQKEEIEQFKSFPLLKSEEDSLITQLFRLGILPPSRFKDLDAQLNSELDPSQCGGVREPTVWRFFNAVTQVMKNDHPDVVAKRTGSLFKLCRAVVQKHVLGRT